jgi:hypothetical protein
MATTAEKFFLSSFRKENRMANKTLLFMVLFISAVFLVDIPGACLAQPGDNTEINKQDTSPKELTVDQQVETRQDRKIRTVQGLRILERRESPAQTMMNATDRTRKEAAASVATD